MINILFFANDFAPLRSGGTFRSIYFVKYLRKFGINPIVLTDDFEYSIKYNVYKEKDFDYNLNKVISDDIKVHYIKQNWEKYKNKGRLITKILDYFRVSEGHPFLWEKEIIKYIKNNIDISKISLIYCSIPPFYTSLIAVKMAKIFKLPLILDFRDPWLIWRTSPYSTYLHYYFTRFYEKRCIEKAQSIIVTSDQTMKDYIRLYPSIPISKYHLITNGYDAEISDWNFIDSNNAKFIFGYVGSFYYSVKARQDMFSPWWKKKGHRALQYLPQKQDWLYRSPFYFFKAISQMFLDHPEMKTRVEIRFAGTIEDWLIDMVKEFNLSDNFQHLGLLPHKEALEFQQSCNALLLTSAKVIEGEDYSIAGKTFEYISMHKPIIGFVCKGAQQRILQNSGVSLICDPDDSITSSKKLFELINGNLTFSPNVEFLNRLSRENLTLELSNVINETIKSFG